MDQTNEANAQQDAPTAAHTLGDLPQLTREQLASLWLDLIKTLVPKSLSHPLMLRFVAFELQAREHGGLPPGFVERLVHMVSESGRGKAPPAKLRSGGRLLREWNGTTHVVDVVDGGFVWRGGTYTSLSAIAKEITGTHWSGPRFFGTARKADQGGVLAKKRGSLRSNGVAR